MISVNFRSDVQEFTARHFPSKVGLSIYGKITGLAGLGEPSQNVRCEIIDEYGKSIYFKEDSTNLWGDYSFYVKFENDGTYTIVLSSAFSAAGVTEARIPVSVGSAELPKEAPKIEEQSASFEKYIKYAVIILVAVVLLYGLRTYKQLAT